MRPRANPEADAKLLMSIANFDYYRRREWLIWASKHQLCEKCKAEPWTACINLNVFHTQKGRRVAKRLPHDERIDWNRLMGGLKQRGFGDFG